MKSLNVLLSPHTESLLEDIVLGIAEALSVEDGLRWEDKLRKATLKNGGRATRFFSTSRCPFSPRRFCPRGF